MAEKPHSDIESLLRPLAPPKPSGGSREAAEEFDPHTRLLTHMKVQSESPPIVRAVEQDFVLPEHVAWAARVRDAIVSVQTFAQVHWVLSLGLMAAVTLGVVGVGLITWGRLSHIDRPVIEAIDDERVTLRSKPEPSSLPKPNEVQKLALKREASKALSEGQLERAYPLYLRLAEISDDSPFYRTVVRVLAFRIKEQPN